MALHGLDTEVVPHLDSLVVASSEEVGLVHARVKPTDIVDTFVVRVHGEVGAASAERPHFDGKIGTGGGEGDGVFIHVRMGNR